MSESGYKIEELHKEIDLIQNCIARMTNNSFLLKGWFMTLISGIIALTYKCLNLNILILMFCLTIIFWYLDAFFLRVEKLYIALYNWIIKDRLENKDDYEYKYELNLNRFQKDISCIPRIMFTKTLAPIYGSVIFGLSIIALKIIIK